MENLENEIWKPVVGYEELYEVSSIGRVKSLGRRHYKSKILKPGSTKKGYKSVNLSDNNCINKRWTVHRIVLLAFTPNPENKPWINHIDNNPSNNRIENLEWCTPRENTQHALKYGNITPYKKKIKGTTRRTTEKDKEDIRKYLAQNMTVKEICKITGIKWRTLYDVIKKLYIESSLQKI